MKVGILGCTGLVGQKYISLLRNHPWFTCTFFAASARNVGRLVEGYAIQSLDALEHDDAELYFSALPSSIAPSIETRLAKAGKWVISNSAAFRHVDDIPLIIPEINPDALSCIEAQRKRFGTRSGGIVAKPNCTLQGYLLPLFPLHKKARLKQCLVTNLQALSGGGKKCIGSLVNTIDPYIPHEEEKSETEPHKILEDSSISISAHCLRVPVLHGHMSTVSALFDEPLSNAECIEAWNKFSPLALPSAPSHSVVYTEDPHRPQVAYDIDQANGMAVTVGRLRQCAIHSIKFVALSHNLVRGAAGGGVLLAELIAHKEGWYDSTQSEYGAVTPLLSVHGNDAEGR